jgi:alpha-1,6-mannosyltransferase
MKIVDVSEFYAERGGGVRTYSEHKLRAASALGHELVIIAPGPRDAESVCAQGRVVWVASPRLPLDPRYHVFTSNRAVHAALARERPDVIEGSSPWLGGWAAGSFPTSALKSLIFHQDVVAVYGHTLLDWALSAERIDASCGPYFRYVRRLARSFDLTVTAGAWLENRLQAHGVANARTVPFGCDTAAFRVAERDVSLRDSLLERTGVPRHGALLVTVARHHPEKRLGTLFQALRVVRRQRPVGLVVYGDGPLHTLVRHWARRAGGVYLAGHTRDRYELARVMASADALLHGSSAETYGLAVAEALAAGLPVIVPDRGGAAELTSASVGEHYPTGDVQACAAAIHRLLDRPAAALRMAARSHALRQVRSLDQHFEELFALYASRLAQTAGVRRASAATLESRPSVHG